jgi:hypothetical protein
MIERHWNADLLAKVFGGIFIIAGIVGFFDNPVVSPNGLFRVNDAHNWLHIGTGILFLAGAYARTPVTTIRAIAVLYAIIAIINFAWQGPMMFDVFAMNMADRWLHAAIAVVLLVVGFFSPAEERLGHARM